jgi:hypothetical protein
MGYQLNPNRHHFLGLDSLKEHYLNLRNQHHSVHRMIRYHHLILHLSLLVAQAHLFQQHHHQRQ